MLKSVIQALLQRKEKKEKKKKKKKKKKKGSKMIVLCCQYTMVNKYKMQTRISTQWPSSHKSFNYKHIYN